MSKQNLTVHIDYDLVNFIEVYARENRTTVSDLITQFFLSLRQHTKEDSTDSVISDPYLRKAIIKARSRLRNGTAEWHTFEEVFGD